MDRNRTIRPRASTMEFRPMWKDKKIPNSESNWELKISNKPKEVNQNCARSNASVRCIFDAHCLC